MCTPSHTLTHTLISLPRMHPPVCRCCRQYRGLWELVLDLWCAPCDKWCARCCCGGGAARHARSVQVCDCVSMKMPQVRRTRSPTPPSWLSPSLRVISRARFCEVVVWVVPLAVFPLVCKCVNENASSHSHAPPPPPPLNPTPPPPSRCSPGGGRGASTSQGFAP